MNVLSKQDKDYLEGHFKDQLSNRYGIEGDSKGLQKSFIKRVRNGKAVIIEKQNKGRIGEEKYICLTKFNNKKVLFVYNPSLNICKTALTYKG